MMNLRPLLAKITSVGLIISGLYQILLSIHATFFIYPNLQPLGQETFLIQEGLVEKALLLYASMMTSGIYGTALLFKPKEKVKILHIIFGVLLFFGSIFFVSKTPFTTDPIIELIKEQLSR